jgi:hypothetical protein
LASRVPFAVVLQRNCKTEESALPAVIGRIAAARLPSGVWAVVSLLLSMTTFAFCGEIHDATKAGDLGKVKMLLQSNPGLVSDRNNDGETPLHTAAESGRKEVAELLLANKADVNAKAKDGGTPLHLAAYDGQDAVAAVLLANGASVNAVNNSGFTPLHLAAYKNHKELVRLLIGNKADLNARTTGGSLNHWTPLHIALSQGFADVAEELLKAGADVNAANGNTYGACCALVIPAWFAHRELVPLVVKYRAAHPWLSKIKAFDPATLNPMVFTSRADGTVTVGGTPLVLWTHHAARPWKMPDASASTPPVGGMAQNSSIVRNYFYWNSDPENKSSHRVRIVSISDDNGNHSGLEIAPPVYLSPDGVLYSEASTEIATNGPFVTVEVNHEIPTDSRIELLRGNSTVVLQRGASGRYAASLSDVKPFEPLTVVLRNSAGEITHRVEVDCQYRGAAKGLVFIVTELR